MQGLVKSLIDVLSPGRCLVRKGIARENSPTIQLEHQETNQGKDASEHKHVEEHPDHERGPKLPRTILVAAGSQSENRSHGEQTAFR